MNAPSARAARLRAEFAEADLSVAEVAHILSVDRTTVLRYLHDHTIFAYQRPPGREWFIPIDELRATVAALKRGSRKDTTLDTEHTSSESTPVRAVCATCNAPAAWEIVKGPAGQEVDSVYTCAEHIGDRVKHPYYYRLYPYSDALPVPPEQLAALGV